MELATDGELVELTRSGDKAAFGKLIGRYQGLIYGLAYHQVGNFADAQDIAQEAFIKAYRCLGQLGQPERFAAWLKAVAANECRMWLRGNGRHTASLEEAEASYASMADERWRRRERQAEVRQAVDSLPEKSRLLVTLHYLSGLSHREIGEFLDMPANAVAQHLHRARKQLRDLLMAEIEEGYAMNRLPETFTEDVLGRVTLHPMSDGNFCTRDEGREFAGLMVGVDDTKAERSIVTLWLRRDDLEAIILGSAGRTAEGAKGRALDSTLEILHAAGLEMKQVVFRLSEQRTCRAMIDLRQGDAEFTADLRPSDALGLAVRAGVPVYAEDPVVRAGDVGEDDVPVPEEHVESEAFQTELQKQKQVDELRDRAFEMGLSPEDMVDTAHYHRDEAAGVLRMWIEAMPDRQSTFDLREYGPGIDMLYGLAANRNTSDLVRDGKLYRVSFSMLGEDARIRIVPQPEDAEVPPGLAWSMGPHSQ